MKLIKLIMAQVLILCLLLGLSVSLYPDIIKVRVVKPKKSKTQQEKEKIEYEIDDKPVKLLYALLY